MLRLLNKISKEIQEYQKGINIKDYRSICFKYISREKMHNIGSQNLVKGILKNVIEGIIKELSECNLLRKNIILQNKTKANTKFNPVPLVNMRSDSSFTF